MNVNVPKTFLAYLIGVTLTLLLTVPIAFTVAGNTWQGITPFIILFSAGLIIMFRGIMWDWGKDK